MHIAMNGWFWNQEFTGSGQYLRNLVKSVMKADPDLQVSLILPPHIQNPDNVPETCTGHTYGQSPKNE